MSGDTAGCRRDQPVKVVIINTQYVETDATSFKSVVQKLTGKDDSRHLKVAAAARNANNSERKALQRDQVPAGAGSGHGSSFNLMRDMSFKEFDRLLREMPSLNDDDVLWSESYL